MKMIRIKDPQNQYFGECLRLYMEAFPREERRDEEYLREALLRPEFRPTAIVGDSGEFMGLLFWWQFEKLVYVEHFAILPELRCKGLGGEVVSRFVKSHTLPVLLETEMPRSELSKRRIGFYERLGFVQNQERYFQPKYYPEAPLVELKLLTYPIAFGPEMINLYKHVYLPRVFFRKV